MRLILFFLISFLSTKIFAQAQSQKETPIRLNAHYFEIAPEDTVNHVYNKLVSYSGDSTKLERIFTLDQEVNRVVLTKPAKDAFHEQVTDQYNAYNELEWRKTKNLFNSKFLTLFYFDNEAVGQVLSESDTLYYVARNGESDSHQQNFNDFEPQISGPKEDWNQFVRDKFRLSVKLYPEQPEEYWIAVLVNEYGMAEKIEWANPLGGNPKIASKYLRVFKLWGNNFSPALDAFGDPVAKWLLIPFKMEGRRRPEKTLQLFQLELE